MGLLLLLLRLFAELANKTLRQESDGGGRSRIH